MSMFMLLLLMLAVTFPCAGKEGVVPSAGKVCQLWLRSTCS
jgi:hypothetical protein